MTDRKPSKGNAGADDVEMVGPDLDDIPVSRLRRKFGWGPGDVEVRDPAGKVVARPGEPPARKPAG
jgi:hypothetical protein